MQVATRTFLRQTGGNRRFLEISWSGLEVETVTGQVGAAGRAQSKTFETTSARDEWIARRIEKASRDGYREGDPADVPVPEPEDAMRNLFQVTSSGWIQIGGDGLGWLWICPGCLDGTFSWQR